MSRAAIGFHAHTGWAAAVALGGSPSSPAVIDRRRLDLEDPAIPRQAYHAASDMDPHRGEALVGKALRAADAAAEREVRSMVDELRAGAHEVVGVGITVKPRPPRRPYDRSGPLLACGDARGGGKELRAPVGPDQKAAAVAAWIALTTSLGRHPNRAGSRARP